MNDNLTCPYCKYSDDKCNFPDFFVEDDNTSPEIRNQNFLLKGIQSCGYNVVTCGMCGQVFLHEILPNRRE